MSDQSAPKLRTLDDLQAAMQESVGGKCDRCRQRPATLRLQVTLRPPTPKGKNGVGAAAASVKANVCEGCGVEVFAVVGRAVGQVAA